MNFAARVLVGMLVMTVLDVPMIKFVIAPTLSSRAKQLVAARPDAAAGLIFYVLYVSLVVFLTHKLAKTTYEAGLYGALLGALAYGTYEFTNKAVINGWPWAMVVVDFSWGIILTALVSASVFYLFQ